MDQCRNIVHGDSLRGHVKLILVLWRVYWHIEGLIILRAILLLGSDFGPIFIFSYEIQFTPLCVLTKEKKLISIVLQNRSQLI